MYIKYDNNGQSAGKIIKNLHMNIGDKIFDWTIISDDKIRYTKHGHVNQFYDLQCTCGKTVAMRKDLVKRALKNGASKSFNTSCRECFIKNRELPIDEEKMSKQMFGRYKSSAIKRNLDFTLTEKQVDALFKSNCYYCGLEPSNIFYRRRTVIKEKVFIYSGIDRIENNAGYTEENTVACCKWCNFSKNTRGQKEFLNWVDKVYNYKLQRLDAQAS